MLQITRDDVNSAPFPHIVKHGILPDDIYHDLKADFPTVELFIEQQVDSGHVGSRVGKGTGFDIYRGDDIYNRLMAKSPAWAKFDAYINSPAFVEAFLATFGDRLDDLGCSANINAKDYDRSLIEPRHVLTKTKTIKQVASGFISSLTTSKSKAGRLFTRLDIEKSMGGYAKPPHCDRENRVCSLIIYFTDMKKEGIEGGELNVYSLKKTLAPADHARHPHAGDVEIVAEITPTENLGIFFPCSNNSYHGVNAVRTEGKARDFLYINISTEAPTCW